MPPRLPARPRRPASACTRAAWRLERFGFTAVHDYELGKSDWLDFDRPHEGTAQLAGDATVADVLDEGPTTARPSEDLAALRHRMEHAGAEAILVTRPDGVLIGVVRQE